MENLIIRNFREKLIATINAEPIGIEVKRLVINEVAAAVSKAADEKVNKELAELERSRKGGEEKDIKAKPEKQKGENEKCQESKSDKKS